MKNFKINYGSKEIMLYISVLLVFVTLYLVHTPSDSELNHLKNYPVDMGWLPVAAAGVSVIGGLLQGAQQKRQARELEKQNARPEYQANNRLQENVAISQQMRSVGLPDQVYNNQLNQIQQGLATGLRNLTQRGGVNAINTNTLLQGVNQATANLNAQDAQEQTRWTNTLMGANQTLARDEQQAFNVNELQPYQQTRQEVASMRRAGTQNIFGSLANAGQLAMMFEMSKKGNGGDDGSGISGGSGWLSGLFGGKK